MLFIEDLQVELGGRTLLKDIHSGDQARVKPISSSVPTARARPRSS